MAGTFLCKLEELPTDSLKQVTLEGERKVCVINAGGAYFACQPYCPHKGIPLCEGALEGATLTCLEHLWQWDLCNGEPMGLAEEPLQMMAVEVEGDSLVLKG